MAPRGMNLELRVFTRDTMYFYIKFLHINSLASRGIEQRVLFFYTLALKLHRQKKIILHGERG